jgi:hypothetical protein
VTYAFVAFAKSHDAAAAGGHMLANRQIDALNEGSVDLPARRDQPLRDALSGAEHHVVAYADQTPAPVLFGHTRGNRRSSPRPASRSSWRYVGNLSPSGGAGTSNALTTPDRNP